MIAPTPGRDSAEVDSAEVDSAEATTTPVAARGLEAPQDVASPAPAPVRGETPEWTSPEHRARDFLERLGRADHPDAERDPLHALFQVAVDYRCSAHGYRELYLHHMRHADA